MSEHHDPIDTEIRAALAQDIDSMVPELDARLTRVQPQAVVTKPSLSWNFLMRPVGAFAVLVFAVGMGFYLGNQQQNPFSPVAISGVDGTFMGTSENLPYQAIYEEAGKPVDVDGFGYVAADATGALSQPSAATESSASDAAEGVAMESEAEEPVDDEATSVADSEDAATSTATTTAAPALQINAANSRSSAQDIDMEQLLSGLFSAQIASVGLWRKEMVVPNQSSLFRVKKENDQTQTKLVTTGLRNPTGVAVDTNGRTYVTEHIADGTLIAIETNGDSHVVKSGLNYPAGLAFAPDQSLYLAEHGRGRVLHLMPDNGLITERSRIDVFSTGFSGQMKTDQIDNPLQQGGPFALTVTDDNFLLVSDVADGKTAIYRFSLDQQKNWWDQLLEFFY